MAIIFPEGLLTSEPTHTRSNMAWVIFHVVVSPDVIYALSQRHNGMGVRWSFQGHDVFPTEAQPVVKPVHLTYCVCPPAPFPPARTA